MQLPPIKADFASQGYRCWHVERGVALWCGPIAKPSTKRYWYVMFSSVQPGNCVSGSWKWEITRAQAVRFFQMVIDKRSKANVQEDQSVCAAQDAA